MKTYEETKLVYELMKAKIELAILPLFHELRDNGYSFNETRSLLSDAVNSVLFAQVKELIDNGKIEELLQ